MGTDLALYSPGAARRAPPRLFNNDEGYALVAVLVFSVLISALALAVMSGSLSLSDEARLLRQETGLEALLEAGVNRGIAAYARPDDDLRSNLFPDGRPVSWKFGAHTLTLSAEAESGKWDLNAGALRQIRELLKHLVGEPAVRSEIESKLAKMRGDGPIKSVASILSPYDRMTSRLDLFERHFTVMTNQRDIDIRTAPSLSVQAYVGLPDQWKRTFTESGTQRQQIDLATLPASVSEGFSQERPLYTFRASTDSSFGRTATLSALVQFGEGGRIHVFTWRMSGKTM